VSPAPGMTWAKLGVLRLAGVSSITDPQVRAFLMEGTRTDGATTRKMPAVFMMVCPVWT
jgi:hypothetical protein